jgi:phosphatidylserine/phosphatidylglycerophosphate/cardiolipin synthase-like enzyme
VEAQLVRTVPENVYDAVPRGDFRILEAYVRALRGAHSLVYLESQFLWSHEIVAILEDKLRRPPSDEFRMVILLPSKANSGEDDTLGQLGRLVAADADNRLLACTLYQRGQAQPVYVHAKIGIVDDGWLTVGSANLNEHSLFNDTELNVVTHDAELARATRLDLWLEHLEREDVDGPAHEVIDAIWKPLAEEQLARRQRGDALTHRLARLPHVSRRSRRLLGPLQSLIVDG